MILIDALYINKGGGAVLLQYLISQILCRKEKDQFFFLLDPRFEKPALPEDQYCVIANSQKARWQFYQKNKDRFSKVFCFANTPPPIRLRARVYTYFHNQKLLEAPDKKFEKNYRKIYVKYLIVKLFNRNTDYYIVQTQHMTDEILRLKLKKPSNLLQIPFYDNAKYKGGGLPFAQRPADEFVFISNPSPQKNYPTLFDAWEYLLDIGEKPLLHVTIDDSAPAVTAQMNRLISKGARITNHVYIDPARLYFNCRYLIFPSVVESFGLPLIEAAESGMKILASDLQYVYDVVKPSITFKPYDKISIANAVRRAMSEELPFPEIVTKNEIGKLIDLLVG